MLKARQVIRIWDETTTPPKPKLVICIVPALGFFYRINSNRSWRPAISLKKSPHHGFLDHDSFIQAGDVLELDDSVISDGLNRHGIVGEVHSSVCEQLIKALGAASFLSHDDKDTIIAALTQAR